MPNFYKTFGWALLFSTLGLISCVATISAPQVDRQSSTSVKSAAPILAAGEVPEPVEAAIPREPTQPAQATAAGPQESEANKADTRHRERIVGVWKQNNTGIRWLRVRPDGTATMFIDPDWVAKAIIGDSLIIEIEWTIEDGRALMNSISGRPNTAFKAVSKLFGTARDQPIIQLDDNALVLRNESEDSLSEWSRVDSAVPLPKAISQ